jgi:hypothetical protein
VDYSYLETLYGARGAVCARGDVEFLSWRWQCCSRMLSFSVYFSLFMFSWAGKELSFFLPFEKAR